MAVQDGKRFEREDSVYTDEADKVELRRSPEYSVGGIIGRDDAVGVTKLKEGLAILAGAKVVVLVDLGILGQLAVRLERAGLVGRVLEDDVALVVLEITQREEDDVALVDPDLFAHFTANLGMLVLERDECVCEPGGGASADLCRGAAMQRESHETEGGEYCRRRVHPGHRNIKNHLQDLGVLLTVLLEGEFSTLVIVFLGTTTAVLATLRVAESATMSLREPMAGAGKKRPPPRGLVFARAGYRILKSGCYTGVSVWKKTRGSQQALFVMMFFVCKEEWAGGQPFIICFPPSLTGCALCAAATR
ncbi:hypothetical protein CCM_06542 [Cordyceps militaris CM01]|uniref:Uncharacterized protein n=1 Tax=Cordyceps militaris (strain CM01) TaxID=983644 RepID=G3JMU1_CORMM|nr:uncharacterized protein CCM_06542 [Cordyceps militaris CM01]EGX90123.1 hypothetical protein CCM_06542 [Cordyceps militaris CM01]